MYSGHSCRRLLVGLSAAVLLTGLSSCSSDESAAPPASSSPGVASPSAAATSSTAGSAPASSAATTIEGIAFVADEVTGSHVIAPGSTITLTFQDGNLTADAGCNNLFAQYSLDGDVLRTQLGSTMMACEQALMDQDSWLTAFLESAPTTTYDSGVLTLTNGTDTIVFKPESGGTQGLESTGWRLRGFITKTTGAGTFTGIDSDLKAWIRFAGTEVAYNNSCNIGGGSVEIDAATITFGTLQQSRIFCDGSSGGTEAAMAAVLQGATTYTLGGSAPESTLTIMSTDGKSGLQFAADPAVGANAFASGSATATAVTTS